MVTWKENVVNDSDKTMNTVDEGCDLNDADNGCIDLVSECGHMRSRDSEDDTPLQTRMNRELYIN
jgi:hypothetical protein